MLFKKVWLLAPVAGAILLLCTPGAVTAEPDQSVVWIVNSAEDETSDLPPAELGKPTENHCHPQFEADSRLTEGVA